MASTLTLPEIEEKIRDLEKKKYDRNIADTWEKEIQELRMEVHSLRGVIDALLQKMNLEVVVHNPKWKNQLLWDSNRLNNNIENLKFIESNIENGNRNRKNR